MKYYFHSFLFNSSEIKAHYRVKKEGFSILNNIIIQLFSYWEILDKYINKSLWFIFLIGLTFLSPFFFSFIIACKACKNNPMHLDYL